ncbi:methyltransferase domain-containing protein [Aliiglaciecola sp. CAU 1673]|uniref:methyltransferase domain-containing protein n=1 Tax=Aliiglaciecola sp. CAU 1673 TaxID=3032595 RepID=UPI0023DC5746|nr:methyltransferase domain-containing protein [Aliiglaciecola sp. CAU 1673]MDF2177587.1 methyltransferase domain-containing protein [Aliiglaciecola sp. CAU 1673]
MNKQTQKDQSFDQIAEKFDRNIYGTSKGKLRHELLLHHLSKHLPVSPLKVLDAGGGTGVMTQSMLELGHQVLLNDVSEDALTLAKDKLSSAGDVRFHCGPIVSLPETEQFDLVICHAVLEWLSEPFDTVDHLLKLVAPGGCLSLSFFNRDAHLFSNLIYGNFDYIKKDFIVPNRVRLNPNNSLYPAEVIGYFEKAGWDVFHKAGIRCFHDYVRDKSLQQSHYEELKASELAYGDKHPYLWLGRYFHLLARPVTG